VAHVTASHNLVQNPPYRPKLNQIFAPNDCSSVISICQSKVFCLAHLNHLSQTEVQWWEIHPVIYDAVALLGERVRHDQI